MRQIHDDEDMQCMTPYTGTDWRFIPRDSRYLFGDLRRFQVEPPPDSDWVWGLGIFLVGALLLAAWVTYRVSQ